MASAIGPVQADGGNLLWFLKEVRRIAEGPQTVVTRRAALKTFIRAEEWSEICVGLGGRQAIVDLLFPPFLKTVKGLPTTTIEALWQSGLTTPAAIAHARDESLSAFPGLGPARIARLRAACSSAPDPDAEYVDLCTR